MIKTALLALALLSIVLGIWQWLCARRFRLYQRADPSKASNFSFTILKPLKGCDSQTKACLESWFKQGSNASIQILLGVASPEDPVCRIVRELIAAHPEVRAELVICEPILGPNAKVSTLCHLAPKARGDYLIVSDDDVFVPPEFMDHLSSIFRNPHIGLVNCFYILPDHKSFASRWEAVAVNSDFWSQVLQGLSLKPMDFALGAVMAIPRSRLRDIGGFDPLLEYLADDYQLGNRVAKTGAQLVLASLPVFCFADPISFSSAWTHQLRWARTIRFCQPLPYFFSILSNSTFWPLLYLCVHSGLYSVVLFAAAIIIRGLTAFDQYRLLTQKKAFFPLFFAPVKDLLQFCIWLCAFIGRTVIWRGQKYNVVAGGKLVSLTSSANASDEEKVHSMVDSR